MRTLKYLIEKEFKQIWRNPIIPKMILGYPVMVLLIFPWAINFEVKNIHINIVDQNKSSYSQRLINKIDASAYFIVNDVTTSYESSLQDMESGKCDIILEIPSSFDESLVKEKNANISIVANALNTTQGLLGNNYLTEIITDFSSDLRFEINPILITQKAHNLEIVPRYRYNETLDYKVFMLPAFIVLMITLICGILPSLNVVLEKEIGTIHQINTTANFATNNKTISWLVGGLNFQIEHHLFPKICHIHYPAIGKIVKETALEFNLPYIESPTFMDALASHYRMLKKLGKEAYIKQEILAEQTCLQNAQINVSQS